MPDPPILLFLHIPKTAGMTLLKFFWRKFGLWPPGALIHHDLTFGFYKLGDDEARARHINALPPRRQERVRLYHGHYGYGVHELLTPPSEYFTVLREPIARTVSCFGEVRKRGHIDATATLEQYLREGRRYADFFVDDAHVRALAGDRGKHLDVPFGEVGAEHLELAKRRLESEIAAFGLLERFDESLLLLKRRLGWRSCYYVRENIAGGAAPKPTISDEARGLLESVNRQDAALYAFAEDLFERRLDASAGDIASEVERFRRRNARRATIIRPINRAMQAGGRVARKLKGS